KVGALIELQNYSRSEQDSVPEYGRWDCKGSRLWLNNVEILAPIWKNHGQRVDRETPLADENMAARKPVILHLEKGWNTVRMQLPYVPTPGIRLNKWMFTFVFTDPEGQRALDLDYDPFYNNNP
ncbi:MAG: glycosyl hydrolase family 20, partial [Prevotella sp.]|nr:glycosyl hydrolase family 20 [Prevotella sp.]